jgi:hypothetical protein
MNKTGKRLRAANATLGMTLDCLTEWVGENPGTGTGENTVRFCLIWQRPLDKVTVRSISNCLKYLTGRACLG